MLIMKKKKKSTKQRDLSEINKIPKNIIDEPNKQEGMKTSSFKKTGETVIGSNEIKPYVANDKQITNQTEKSFEKPEKYMQNLHNNANKLSELNKLENQDKTKNGSILKTKTKRAINITVHGSTNTNHNELGPGNYGAPGLMNSLLGNNNSATAQFVNAAVPIGLSYLTGINVPFGGSIATSLGVAAAGYAGSALVGYGYNSITGGIKNSFNSAYSSITGKNTPKPPPPSTADNLMQKPNKMEPTSSNTFANMKMKNPIMPENKKSTEIPVITKINLESKDKPSSFMNSGAGLIDKIKSVPQIYKNYVKSHKDHLLDQNRNNTLDEKIAKTGFEVASSYLIPSYLNHMASSLFGSAKATDTAPSMKMKEEEEPIQKMPTSIVKDKYAPNVHTFG